MSPGYYGSASFEVRKRHITPLARVNDLLESNDTLKRSPRFATVGALGTALDVGLFTVLHVLLGVPTLAANTISYSAGIINNYVLHRNWTYADRPRKAVGAQFPQFLAISLSALLFNNLLVLLLAPPLESLFLHPGYGDLLAKVCATAVGMCWNFAASSLWAFARPAEGAEQ